MDLSSYFPKFRGLVVHTDSKPQSLEVILDYLKFPMHRSKNVPEGLTEIMAGGVTKQRWPEDPSAVSVTSPHAGWHFLPSALCAR